MDGKTKVAGPLAAAGAVSLGLVFIGACGIGQEDTYVPPPPIHSGPQAVEQAGYADPSATTVAQVPIPPSPTWRMAPEPPPRRTLPPEYQISTTSSPTDSGETTDSDETTRQATRSAAPSPSSDSDEDSAASSTPLTEIEPAHREAPVAPPTPTGSTPAVPVPTTTIEAPGTAATPSDPESPATTATPDRDSTPRVEPARTTQAPSESETGESTPFGLPSETTVPESGTPVPTITVVPARPPGFGD